MKLVVLFVVAVVIVQKTRACASSCTGASLTRVVNKTVERVEVNDVDEAHWRGACHSVCITVSIVMNIQYSGYIGY